MTTISDTVLKTCCINMKEGLNIWKNGAAEPGAAFSSSIIHHRLLLWPGIYSSRELTHKTQGLINLGILTLTKQVFQL